MVLTSLVTALAEKRSALERKVTEAQADKAVHATCTVRTNAADEASKPEERRCQETLAAALQAAEGYTSEVSQLRTMYAAFADLQKNPSAKSKAGVNVLMPQLKLMGVEKKATDGLAAALAKRKPSQADKKLLSSVDGVFVAYVRSKASVLDKSKVDVKQSQDALATVSLAMEARARELLGHATILKTREAECRACEEEVEAAVSKLSEHEKRMTTEGMMRFSSSAETCAVCCDDTVPGAAVKLGCNHGWYCPECVTRFVEARLDTGIAGDVPCPDCAAKIPECDLVKVLPKKTIFRLHARSIEKKAVAGGAEMRSCPTPNCKMRQTIAEGASGRLTCLLCAEESCWLCGVQPYHDGLTCEKYAERQRIRGGSKDMDDLFKWMEETGTRQCPKCGMATTKENLAKQSEQRAECHKMLCMNCGTRFCFKCCAVLTDTYTCKCSSNKHGFIDPRTGEVLGHLKRGKGKTHSKKPPSPPNSGGC